MPTLPRNHAHTQRLPAKSAAPPQKESSQTLLQKLWGQSPIWVEELEEFPTGQAGRRPGLQC